MASTLLSLAKTPMQAIYEDTCIDIVREVSSGLMDEKRKEATYTTENGLDLCVEEINYTQGIQTIKDKYHNPKITYDGARNYYYFYERFTDAIDISKVGSQDLSVNEALNIVGSLRKDIKDQLYGVLLIKDDPNKKSSKMIINPLHPVISAHIYKGTSGLDLDKKEWTLTVYSFKKIDEIKREFKPLFQEYDFVPEIANIITAMNDEMEYTIENKNFNVDMENESFILKYDEVKRNIKTGELIKEESTESRNFIVPGQVINVRGVAYPNYNTIYSRKGLAWNITPVYAANINHPTGQATSNGREGGSGICTKLGNSLTQRGISALNHSNTTSPLNSVLFNEYSLTYIYQCIDASLELLVENWSLEPKEEKVLTYQEFITENDGATRRQYMSYIKNRMKDKMEAVPDEADDGESKLVEEDLKKEDTLIPQFVSGNTYEEGDLVVFEEYVYEHTFKARSRAFKDPDQSLKWTKRDKYTGPTVVETPDTIEADIEIEQNTAQAETMAEGA